MFKNREFWKIFFSISGAILGIIVIVFVGMMGYYLWQLRYGTEDTISQLSNQYSDKFTTATKGSAVLRVDNPEQLIRPKNPTQGSSDAPVTIIAFMDFECPYSQESYPVLKQVLEQFGPAVRFVFKQLPSSSIHQNALNASIASTCAEEQQQFWSFEDKLFTSKNLDEASLYTFAQSTGLNLSVFNSCYTTKKYKNIVDDDLNDALTAGVRGTPTFIIGNEVVEGVPSKEDWSKLILKHLNQ